MPRALITGITGQDGSYLAEQLLARGYAVDGLVRPPRPAPDADAGAPVRPDHLAAVRGHAGLTLHTAALDGTDDLVALLERVRPDEVYHLAAESRVAVSALDPAGTATVNVRLTRDLLAAVGRVVPEARVLFASSAAILAPSPHPLGEDAPRGPLTVYGSSKLTAHEAAAAARADGLFVAVAILFNHESPRRSDDFVTRKITRAVAEIAAGRREGLELGNLHAVRDWGYAPEYVDAMRRMLEVATPLDVVLATGVGHTVADFCSAAFAHAGLDWRDHVRVDDAHRRSREADALVGDPALAERALGWRASTRALDVARLMVDDDLLRLGAPTG
ncbi:GDP-mannose 4,6-dehydratase [Nocardioides sp.]|uniref:GDP-mannose 4,6-dehydratase n=1 Tax=Nocardioides sp. TaxID=35761 RepID=UPI00351576EE